MIVLIITKIKPYLVRLIEEVFYSFTDTVNQSIRVTKHIKTQNKDVNLANTLRRNKQTYKQTENKERKEKQFKRQGRQNTVLTSLFLLFAFDLCIIFFLNHYLHVECTSGYKCMPSSLTRNSAVSYDYHNFIRLPAWCNVDGSVTQDFLVSKIH